MSLAWLAGPVASLAGSLLGGHSARKAAETSANLQLRNWNIMQSTAHQKEVEDLRKAGLNPILSATNGGNMASASAPSVSDPSDYAGLGNTINNAIKSMLWNDIEKGKLDNQLKEIDIKKEELGYKKDLWESQSNLTNWQSRIASLQEDKLNQEVFELVDSWDLRRKGLELSNKKYEAEIDRVFSEIPLNFAKTSLTQVETEQRIKELKFGYFISKFLPEKFLSDFEKNPTLTLKTWRDEIFKVFKESGKDAGSELKNFFWYFYQLGEDYGREFRDKVSGHSARDLVVHDAH